MLFCSFLFYTVDTRLFNIARRSAQLYRQNTAHDSHIRQRGVLKAHAGMRSPSAFCLTTLRCRPHAAAALLLPQPQPVRAASPSTSASHNLSATQPQRLTASTASQPELQRCKKKFLCKDFAEELFTSNVSVRITSKEWFQQSADPGKLR